MWVGVICFVFKQALPLEGDESSSDGELPDDDASSSGEVLASLRWPCVCGLFLLGLLQGGRASERRRLHVSRPHGLNGIL